MSVLKPVLIAIEVLLLFNLLIFVHELGHFLAARWRGLKVDRFAIWFGKPLWKKKINGVEYALGTIPAGGYVSLPQMATMEAIEGIGVPREIVAFVMPTGYSFNLDGSTLYLSLASIFVAQAAGIHLSVGQQLLMMLTLMLTSKGVAGVSRAAIVILLGTVGSFGLPVEPVFILLGIDQLMDMGRTAVNVLGNCLATVVVARWEGDFDEKGPLTMRVVPAPGAAPSE